MTDWTALTETDATLRKFSKIAEALLGEAHELGLLPVGVSAADAGAGSLAKTLKKRLRDSIDIRAPRFVLDDALAEKTFPKFVGECLVHQLFPRSNYNINQPKQAFVSDILDLMEDAEPVCCLSVFRSMRSIGRNERFVPPSGKIVESILAEEAALLALLGGFVRLQQLKEMYA